MKYKPSIAVVSGAHSDAGIWIPILDGLHTAALWNIQLVLTGSHTLENSNSASIFMDKGYHQFDQVVQKRAIQSHEDMGRVCAELVQDFIIYFQQRQPDVLMLLGDRYETYAAALAAWFLGIPIAHIHGGETTEGALDDGFRNSISHFSQLHFTAHATFRDKLISMGLPPAQIFVSGAPGLDRFRNLILPDRKSTLSYLGLPPDAEYIFVVFHPVTRLPDAGVEEWRAIEQALDAIPLPVVIHMGSPDAGNQALHTLLMQWIQGKEARVKRVEHPGETWFPALMKHCLLMAGNSSAALIEAPFFNTPVLNIGMRQQGRLMSEKGIQVPANADAIVKGIELILENTDQVRPDASPYGNGKAVQVILRELERYFKNETNGAISH